MRDFSMVFLAWRYTLCYSKIVSLENIVYKISVPSNARPQRTHSVVVPLKNRTKIVTLHRFLIAYDACRIELIKVFALVMCC